MYEYRKLTPVQQADLVRERRMRGFPPHSPPHPIRDQTFYLLTAACYEHQCHRAAADRRQQLLDALFERFLAAGLEIRAWVILPNHYHVLTYIPDFAPVARLFRHVHGVTSRDWNLAEGRQGRKVWFGFTDRAMRSEGHYYTTLNYLHYNPLKHGWAASPYDWAESSVHWYREFYGRAWLRDQWARHPIHDYGRDWDDLPAAREDRGGLTAEL